jgi:predicted amidohydrolase
MICYDREFPESARILMLQGAEIIVAPNACPLEINRLSQLRGRAYENMVGIATCNFPQGHPDCNGHSAAYDGVAYLPTLMGSRDTCIAEAGGEEGIYMASFDMDMLRDYRSREVHGNAYRRPELYGALVEDVVKAPFIRKDKR